MLKTMIENGHTSLGIELGSTRIKAVLLDGENNVAAAGGYSWENSYINGLWTYSLDEVWKGIRECYRSLSCVIRDTYGVALTNVGSIGISAMMHGYLPFDRNGVQLAPFRTWRNTNTAQAAKELTEAFHFKVPLRWSVSHLWQAILDGESHIQDIAYLTTLSGYVHWMLTGQKALGIGDASGMFPIDSAACDYNARMLSKFNDMARHKNVHISLKDILPAVRVAGETCGSLTAEGARMLDPSGNLKAGIPLCAPEGDAGTGMVATNSIAPGTGNVSAGTSIFAMIVLEKDLPALHTEVDMLTTPAGSPVAVVQSNTCTSDIDAWAKLLGEAAEAFGAETDTDTLYSTLYQKALEGDADCGGMLSYNYYSGEPITNTDGGSLVFVRMPDSVFTLANFMRTHLFSALGTLKIGMDILFDSKNVRIDMISGHGGFFKTKGVGQRFLAAALRCPVTVMETAGEGGAWGMAILAAYMRQKKGGETLENFISGRIFSETKKTVTEPLKEDMDSFDVFMQRYKKGIEIQKEAVRAMRTTV